MHKYLSTTLPLLAIITTAPLGAGPRLDKLAGFFGRYNHETIVEKEFELKKSGNLIINNTCGSITITTEWQRNSICLKAIKQATCEADLEKLSISAIQADEHNQLTIDSVFEDPLVKARIDYELIVPAQTKLCLNADNGNITVNDAKGTIVAHTMNGSIDIHNTANSITAQTEEQGSITIANAQGAIKATTNKGNITIEHAHNTIIANTQKGSIITSCARVPTTSRIILETEQSGAIDLTLPSSVNATVHGKTSKGRLTSDHYITLKPVTTKLTKKTRRDLEKQVDGILGTGEADIRVTSNSGNIRILETKTV